MSRDRSWDRGSDWRGGGFRIEARIDFRRDFCNPRFFRSRPFCEFIGPRTEWADIAFFAGFIGFIGALEHDDFLCFAGSAGALYATWRFEEDLACSDPCRHARACYFSMPFFYRDGCRYERRFIERDGDCFYQFVRCD